MKGYTGKILKIDLSLRTWQEEFIEDTVYETYLSGLGLGAYILTRDMTNNIDPLGPDNLLGFVAGILTGTGAMFSGRWMVVGKSPLTGGWGDANCGGNFGPAIKQCGYDGIFVTGSTTTPVYLLIDGKSISIRDATDVWGKDAVETERILGERHGKKARVASIGQGGENLSLISGIVNDRGRLAGRSGLGAVMGSKKLKAIVLVGSQSVGVTQPDELHKISKGVAALMPKGGSPIPSWALPLAGFFLSKMKPSFRTDGLMTLAPFRAWGTTSGNELSVINGDAPVRNWRGLPRQFKTKAVSADKMVKTEKKKYHCNACPLGCGGINEIEGEYSETHRPEYETVTAFGALVGNQNLGSIFYLNEYLNRAGVDSISAGSTVAFAIDCYENGVLTNEDTGGLVLHWGNTTAIVQLVKWIVERKGIGDLLADGVQIAANKIGKGSAQFAIHAGGQELPMHDPRHDPGYALFYVSDPTPGRHTIGSNQMYELYRLWSRVSWAPEVPKTYNYQDHYLATEHNAQKMAASGMVKMVLDSAGFCLFGLNIGVDRLGLFEYLNAATGWQKTPDEYMEIGRRIQSLRQAFNISQGIEPAEVLVNSLVSGEFAAVSGPNKGKHFDLSMMRKQYWKAMGWNPGNGHPENIDI